ncbi:MAG: hypothetical protein H7246_13590 [Phycisphaerae bacterium]|nr:hypothetical protein [Saprospiraceae bacterium]
MGVTIHYRGRLRQKKDIEAITLEVEDLCKSAHWKYHLWNGMDENKPLHGISFQTHPESESVWMTFDKEGVLHNFFSIDGTVDYHDEEGYPWNFTKTQFAGVEAHIVVCKLLRFLGDKYFEDWKVMDEGRYYETGDATYLKQVMDFISDAINDLSESLTDIPAKDGESLVQYITDIAKRFAQRNPPPTPPEEVGN